jgi:alcohol dehydrogenase class IV
MRFEFATATHILFGSGTAAELGRNAASFGKNAMLVTNTMPGGKTLLDSLRDNGLDIPAQLAAAGVQSCIFGVPGEPTVELVLQGLEQARACGCDVFIGLGGGSAIDAAKAIAALLANGGHPLDYLEVIGRGQPLTKASLPFIAVPTTAGTGAEVTRNAVIGSPEHQVKVSLRSAGMLARLALVDPQLTLDLPPAVTASTGLDALTQVIEPYVSSRANPLVDAMCVEGITRAARSLRKVYEHGSDLAAREDMCVTSLFGGLALANAGLGAVHGFAAPLGGWMHAAHGTICACLLPYVMEVNVRAMQQRQPQNPALPRYQHVARLLTGSQKAGVEDGIRWVQELTSALSIPNLTTLGMKTADVALIVEKAAVASSMQGNPLKLTTEELTEILTRAST